MNSQNGISPKVTICLPTIGRLTYIDETLDSLRSQTLQDYELLVLYNGTDAAVRTRLELSVEQHPGGRVLSEECPMPMFANFNRGLREARGQYVAFFHDDDSYEPGFLATMTGILDTNGNAPFAGSNYFIINEAGKLEGERRLIRDTGIQKGSEFIATLIARGRAAIPTPGIVFRKSAFSADGWDERLSMHFGDYIVLMRMAEHSDPVLIAEPLMRLRLHGTNASNLLMSKAAPMQYDAIQHYIRELEGRRSPLASNSHELFAKARSSYNRMLLWGWISAVDDQEGGRCIHFLGQNGNRQQAAFLRLMQGIGMRAARRRALAGIIRRLGRTFG